MFSKSPNEIDSIEDSLSELKQSKCIYIKRDLLGLVKSRALDLNLRKKKILPIILRENLFSKYLDNIKKF